MSSFATTAGLPAAEDADIFNDDCSKAFSRLGCLASFPFRLQTAPGFIPELSDLDSQANLDLDLE